MSSEKVYKETKQILLGNKVIKAEFKPLADWIDKTYGVRTINIFYDTIDNGSTPRIEICFKHRKEKKLFDSSNGQNYDAEKQRMIGEKFKESLIYQDLNNIHKISKYKKDNIFVIFGDVESIAKIEANQSIPESKIKSLKKELNNKDIWDISRAFERTTIFLYTDDHVKKYTNSDVHKEWSNKYYELLSEYDEFGFFKRECFYIALDSKESFDTKFESSWFYYYK